MAFCSQSSTSSQATQLSHYLSDSEDKENEEISNNQVQSKTKRLRGVNRDYVVAENDLTLEEALSIIKSVWSKKDKKSTRDGIKQFYRCKGAKYVGLQCASAIYILYHPDNTEVSIYRTYSAHTHQINPKILSVNIETQNFIRQLYENGTVKPSRILKEIEIKASTSNSIVVPLIKHLNNQTII